MNKKPSGFEKFANKKKAGTIKEQFKKERRVEKKEISESIDQRFEERRKSRSQPSETPAGRSTRGPIQKKDHTGSDRGRSLNTGSVSGSKPALQVHLIDQRAICVRCPGCSRRSNATEQIHCALRGMCET